MRWVVLGLLVGLALAGCADPSSAPPVEAQQPSPEATVDGALVSIDNATALASVADLNLGQDPRLQLEVQRGWGNLRITSSIDQDVAFKLSHPRLHDTPHPYVADVVNGDYAAFLMGREGHDLEQEHVFEHVWWVLNNQTMDWFSMDRSSTTTLHLEAGEPLVLLVATNLLGFNVTFGNSSGAASRTWELAPNAAARAITPPGVGSTFYDDGTVTLLRHTRWEEILDLPVGRVYFRIFTIGTPEPYEALTWSRSGISPIDSDAGLPAVPRPGGGFGGSGMGGTGREYWIDEPVEHAIAYFEVGTSKVDLGEHGHGLTFFVLPVSQMPS